MEINLKNFIFFVISISFFLLSQIFLLVQGIENYKFFKFDDEKIIVEKTLFEQFSQEVYESINTPFSTYEITSVCDITRQIRFPLYLNTYYDCRNIYSSELKKECKNNIISNNTDCTPGISNTNYNYNVKYEDRINYDVRIKYCQYFSRFTQKISKIYNYYFCRDNNLFTYEDLLFKSVPLYDLNGGINSCPNGKKCGILDTKKNILCLPYNYDCPYNDLNIQSGKDIDINTIPINDTFYLKYSNSIDKNILSSFIISENQPMNHEWDIYVRETYEDTNEEDIIKRRRLNTKDFELVGDKDDNSYEKLNISSKVKEILESNNMNSNIQASLKNKNQNQSLNIYARNYIGFKNYEELLDFKKNFNEKDPKDNPLYKLASSGHNPLITIIFSSVFFVLGIVLLILGIRKCKSKIDNKKLILIVRVVNCIFFIVELFIIAFHFVKYPKIHIDMDERMQKVLDLYNDRTFSTQVYRIISLVFSTVSLIFINIKFSEEENLIHND